MNWYGVIKVTICLSWQIFYHILFLETTIREFKQITAAGASTAAMTEKVRGEYVSVVYQILAKRNTKMSETSVKEFKIYFI